MLSIIQGRTWAVRPSEELVHQVLFLAALGGWLLSVCVALQRGTAARAAGGDPQSAIWAAGNALVAILGWIGIGAQLNTRVRDWVQRHLETRRGVRVAIALLAAAGIGTWIWVSGYERAIARCELELNESAVLRVGVELFDEPCFRTIWTRGDPEIEAIASGQKAIYGRWSNLVQGSALLLGFAPTQAWTCSVGGVEEQAPFAGCGASPASGWHSSKRWELKLTDQRNEVASDANLAATANSASRGVALRSRRGCPEDADSRKNRLLSELSLDQSRCRSSAKTFEVDVVVCSTSGSVSGTLEENVRFGFRAGSDAAEKEYELACF